MNVRTTPAASGHRLAASGHPLAASGLPPAASGHPLAASGLPPAASGQPLATSSLPPSTASPMKALAGTVLLLPLLLLPVAALWFAGRPVLVEHARLARFREVRATVVAVGVERRATPGAHGAASYVPRVIFRYRVGEVVHEAGRVTLLDVGGTRWWARRHAERYHVGDSVIAYYDPVAPERAFLERDAPALTATMFLPAPLLALAVLWVAARRRKLWQRGGAEVVAH